MFPWSGSGDVFGAIRTAAMRVGDEVACVDKAHKAALGMPRGWSEHLASLDWFLTYYGRKYALED